MFKFFKEKLKETISHLAKKAETKATEEETPVEEIKEIIKKDVEKDVKEKKKFFSFFTKKPTQKKKTKETKKEESVKEIIEEVKQPINEKAIEETIQKTIEKEEKKIGIFGKVKEKILTKKITEETFNELFETLELTLLENNVAFDVVEKIKNDLKKSLVDIPLLRKDIREIIEKSLRNSLLELFVEGFDLLQKVKEKKPYVILFAGINGSGKTTTIAKITHLLLKHKKTCVLAAADTFRAAAIDQLEEHGKRLGVKVIKQDYGSDAGAVAFDAIKHAEAKHIDVVLIDTAGRLHSNTNLMRELEKVNKVAHPDLTLFIGESITGNDCVEQARLFDEMIGIDGIILTKADVDEKGGAALSISYVTKKPILYLGIGQEMSDLKKFDKEEIIKGLGL